MDEFNNVEMINPRNSQEDFYSDSSFHSDQNRVPEIFSSAEKLTLFNFSNIDKTLSGSDIIRTASDICRINYLQRQSGSSEESIKLRNKNLSINRISTHTIITTEIEAEDDILKEEFHAYVTTLMNEDQLWGCFYTFPELYSDVYSPVVRVKKVEDVPEVIEGVLTRELVAVCLSYLKRVPILGDYVFIKLDLSSKQLTNIAVLQQYKYLVYLDLSSNLLTELSVLSYLPYLQFLSVAFNRLNTVLSYETPQWFLTEVHYKYNSIINIRDLSEFWSLSVLDLSHNNIKHISGLESLRIQLEEYKCPCNRRELEVNNKIVVPKYNNVYGSRTSDYLTPNIINNLALEVQNIVVSSGLHRARLKGHFVENKLGCSFS